MDESQPRDACVKQTQSDHIENALDLEQKETFQICEPEDTMDPRNWPVWKKNTNLALISFNALMTNFIGAGIIPVFSVFAEKFGVSVQTISYFTSIHILLTGLMPFAIIPVSKRFGRQPVWLASTLLTAVFNVGCAKSSSYGAMMVCRVLSAACLSSATALGPPVIVEMYRENERDVKMGIWAALVTLGPPFGPFIMGFVAQRAGWEWTYWTFAIISAVQFVLYAAFNFETRYIRGSASTIKPRWILRRIDPTPFSLSEFYRPLEFLKYVTILIPLCSQSMIFCLSAALLTVEIPQFFAARFGFDAQQIGLQFVGIITGTIMGELFNMVVLKVLQRRQKRTTKPYQYIFVSYLGFLCMVAGLAMFCVLLGKTRPLHYNVSPIIGIGIAGFGNQIVTSFLINYIIQLHTENAATVSILLGFTRQVWCFIGPFWFPPMFEAIGLIGSAGLLVGLVVGSALPLVCLHYWKYGRR